MSDVAIRVEGLGKQYRIGGPPARYDTLREQIIRVLAGPIRALRRRGEASGKQAFWALQDVSFEVKRGEIIGVIGRNGAGKSTLLKILSRITEPTTGEVDIHGRVGSLLEVGTGFNPELTGRENVYLNGAILGMRRQEITRKFAEIVEFAEVEKYLDTPVKHYSSGMYMRLAFAVAAHLEQEILMIDEVLAVGDVEFQKKCLGKIGEVSKGGRTVLFVSHNMAAVEALCSSAIMLSSGKLISQGPTKSILQDYLSTVGRIAGTPLKDRIDRDGSGVIRFTSISLANGTGQYQTSFQCGEDATLVLSIVNTTERAIRSVRLSMGIFNELGQRVLQLDTNFLGKELTNVWPGEGTIRVSIPKLCLLPGRYSFNIYSSVTDVISDWIKEAGVFDVEGGDYFGTGRLPPLGQGVFVTEHRIQYEQALVEPSLQ